MTWNPDGINPGGNIVGSSASCNLPGNAWAISTANQIASGNVTGSRYTTFRQTITITKPADSLNCVYSFRLCCRSPDTVFSNMGSYDIFIQTAYRAAVTSSFSTTAPPVVPVAKAATSSGYGSAFIPVISDAGLDYTCNINQGGIPGFTYPTAEIRAVKVPGGCRIDWFNSGSPGTNRLIGDKAPVPLRVATPDNTHYVDLDFTAQVVDATAAPTVVITRSGAVIPSGSTVQFARGVTSVITFTGATAVAASTSTLTAVNTAALPPGSALTPRNGGSTLASVFTYTPGAADPLTGVITVVFTDNFGQLATGSLSYNIDIVKPVVTPPANKVAEAVSSTGATVSYSGASALDDVSGSLTPTCLPASGALFPIGVTTVTCSATDAAGNTGTATFTVTVRDTTKPVVTAPADKTAEATSAAGAAVSYSGQSATDAVTTSPTVTCAPSSGSVFAIGTTTVSCSATDAAGNTGTATFAVTVRDTTKPVVTAPADKTAEATSAAGAAVSYSGQSATDAVTTSPTVTCAPSSGSVFAIGTTTVSCSATDAAGNTGSTTFAVTVSDTTKPVVTAPADKTAEATSAAGAAVSYSGESATDAVTTSPTVTCTPSSGSVFAIGTTTVSCSATDAAGNTGSATFAVTVGDTTKPVVTAPADKTAEATSAAGAAVSYSGESATDAVTTSPTVTCTPSSGSVFAIGTTTVSCSATDAAGNTGSTTFAVTVSDTTKPVVTAPADKTAEATSAAGAAVSFSGESATDAVTTSPTVTCTPSSGSVFAIGTTTVSCSATDAAGNTGSATFAVTVGDTTKPVVTAPADKTAEATSAAGAAVSFSGESATDAVTTSPTVTCAPSSGSVFAIGTTTVSCSATDAAGNTGSATFAVTVRDTTKPVVTAPADQVADATPGTSYGIVSYSGASATDAVTTSLTVTCTPGSGSSFPVGVTTVTCSATDAAGNTGTATFTVTVRAGGSCAFGGFQAPAPRDPATIDSVTATQTLPAKWTLDGSDFGLGILASGSPYLVLIDCTTKAALPNQSGVPTPTDMSSQLKKSTDGGVTTYQLNYPLQGKNLVRGACYSLNFVFNICPLSTRQWLFKVK